MGYILIDHRASDPAVQREYGKLVEMDTKSCKHCQHTIELRKDKPQAWCTKCMGHVCPTKECTENCRPFQASVTAFLTKVEQQLARDRLYGMLA